MYNIILIPFRDREKHLKYFLENTLPLLNKHLENVKITIIEQCNKKLFNRGLLLNIGFKENLNYENVLYFTHDVDTNPFENTIIEYYKNNIPDENTIKGIFTSIHNTLGGVICFKKDVFIKINGFPNTFWGWGIEDKVLQNRAEFHNINIEKNITDKPSIMNKYFNIFTDEHKRIKSKDNTKKHNTEYYLYNKYSKEKKIEHNKLLQGIDTMKYKIIEKIKFENYENVEIIKVEI